MILEIITALEGGLGSRLRYLYYKRKLKFCGGYFNSMAGFRIHGAENVVIGSGCSFNHGVIIDSTSSILIGNNVLIGQYSVIRDANHVYSNPNLLIKEQGHDKGIITIGNGAWLGSHVVVLKDVHIGIHSVVAACSLVNEKIPPYEVWGGVPAKFLRVIQ